MTASFERVQAVFDRARGVEGTDRQRVLDEECGTDEALRAEVESLLASLEDNTLSPFSETGIAGARKNLEGVLDGKAPQAESVESWLPERVGGYRVLSRIGEGGMGVVYEAEQSSPQRRVAIKLLHPQQSTPERLRRFRHEAELLGRLQHPGIAQIFESGTFDLGRGEQPFFAMELIDGVDVRLHCERARLDVPARLELLARVAEAVDHAHERGVIHRDLKPDNVLVDAHGQPKVLDFGVARASESSDILSTLQTQEGVLLGTLAYMSPEQLTGDPLDVTRRSDVYALGVLAFELLSGRLPHDIGGLSLTAAMRLLQDEPGQRLGALEPSLRGDVETIVHKALEQDPHRRYETASAFAADLRRHLDHLPITARPPSRVYLIKKYARRNRSLVAILGVLSLATIVSVFFGVNALQKSELAERRAYQATMMAASQGIEKGSVTHEFFDSVPPERRGWEWRYLSARREPPLTQLPRVDDDWPVYGFGLLPDGRTLFHALRNGLVVWIDVDTGEVRNQMQLDLDGALHAVSRVAFGQELVVVVPGDRSIRNSGTRPWWAGVWDPDEKKLVARHEFQAFAHSVSMSPGGDRVFAAGIEGAFLMNPRTGERLATRELPGMLDAKIRKDRVVVVEADFSIHVLDMETLQTLHHLPPPSPEDRISPAASLDGAWLAATNQNGDVILWDLSTAPTVRRLFTGNGGVCNPYFSPDGKTLASLHGDNRVRIWDVASGELLNTFSGHDARPVFATFLPGARRMATVDIKGEVRAWTYGTDLNRLTGHTSYVYPVAIGAEHGLVASGGWDGYYGAPGSVRLWDVATGELVASCGEPGEIALALAFSPDGTGLHVALSSRQELGRVWSRIVRIDLPSGRQRELVRRTGGSIYGLAADPAGERLLWSESGTRGPTEGLRHLFVSRSLRDGVVTERDLPKFPPGSDHVPGLSISPDGSWFAIGFGRGGLELGRMSDLEPARQWTPHEEIVRAFAFSPDSRRLVTGSEDQTLRVHAVPGGKELAVLRGHGAGVWSATFSPDGRRLASGDYDGIIRIWDGRTFEPICELTGHEGYVYSLAWHPDGETLVSGSGDGTVRLWTTETDTQRAAAQRKRKEIIQRVEPEVLGWLAELVEPEAVAERIATRDAWSDRERQVARQVLLREGLAR